MRYGCGVSSFVAEAERLVAAEEVAQVEALALLGVAGCCESDAIGSAVAGVAGIWVECYGEVEAGNVLATSMRRIFRGNVAYFVWACTSCNALSRKSKRVVAESFTAMFAVVVDRTELPREERQSNGRLHSACVIATCAWCM